MPPVAHSDIVRVYPLEKMQLRPLHLAGEGRIPRERRLHARPPLQGCSLGELPRALWPYPLPAYQVGGKLLVRRSEFDTWMAAFRRRAQPDVDGIVSDVMRDLA
jgi:hypothetical protein